MQEQGRFTRRQFIKLSSLVTVGGFLAACTAVAPSTTGGTASGAGASAEPIKLRFPHAMGDDGQPVFEAVAKRFQEAHPNVTVAVDPTFDWDAQKVLVEAASGTAADILWDDEHFVYNYSSKGILLDLNPFMEKGDFNKANYDDLFKYYTYKGNQYGIALWSGCYALFYNKSLLDQAGIAEPSDKWTYDDLLTAAKAVTKDTNGDGDPDVWGFLCQTNFPNPWGGTIWAFGGDFFNADGTEFILSKKPNYAGLQWYLDMIHVHKVAPTADTASALAGGGDPFALGLIALKTGSPWNMPTYRKITDFEWDVAPMPTGPSGRGAALTTDSLSIYKGSKAPDMAWAFIEELLSEQSAKEYCANFKGPVPALKSAHQYFLLPDQAPAHQQVFIDAVSYANVPMQSPYSYVVDTPFYQALGSATDGTMSLDDAMASIDKPINDAIAAEVQKG